MHQQIMQIVQDTLSNLELGPQVAVANLSMVPLMASSVGSRDYLTLDEALSQGLGAVMEVSEEGKIPELRFFNVGCRPILLIDGEELIGAKHNRILNLSILAPAARSTDVPVSCVEAGRWSRQSRAFTAAPLAQYATGRARKGVQVSQSLRSSGTRFSNQTDVWSDIDSKMKRLNAMSGTSAMAAMYESHSRRLDDYVNGLGAARGQVGAVFAIDGKVVGLDLFDHAETLRKLLPKIVRSYALDAIDVGAPKTVSPCVTEIQSFLNGCPATPTERFKAVGEGEDLRLTGSNITGAALVADGRIVHLCAFANGNDDWLRGHHRRHSAWLPGEDSQQLQAQLGRPEAAGENGASDEVD